MGLGVAEAGLLLALFKGDLLADGGHRDGHRHDQGRDQLHGRGGHVEPQGHRHDEAVQAAAKDHAAHPQHHRALAQQRLANDEGGQGDGHHAGAHVDVAALLVLGQQGAGQGGQAARDAQAHHDGVARVDAGSADHGGVVAGGPDGQAQPGAEEPDHQHAGDQDDRRHQNQLIPAAGKGQQLFPEGEHRVHPHQAHVGGEAHHRQVDGVQAGVDDDAGHDAFHPEARLQKGCDEAGQHPRRHGGKEGQHRVAGHGHLTADRTAQGEASVGGQVGDVQNGIAQKQRQRHQRVNAAQLQGRLQDVDRKNTSQHGIPSRTFVSFCPAGPGAGPEAAHHSNSSAVTSSSMAVQ